MTLIMLLTFPTFKLILLPSSKNGRLGTLPEGAIRPAPVTATPVGWVAGACDIGDANNVENVAKGTIDPRVEFIYRVIQKDCQK